MASPERTPLLALSGISKRFGAVQALSDAQFEVLPGEVVALVGDNGAGKSTLIKVISGIYPPDQGSIRWQGREVSVGSPNEASALGIATVYQDLALCDNLDVVANLYLGRELGTAGGAVGLMDEVTMERRAVEVLRKLSVKIPNVRTPIAALSGGQRQSVAVAKAVQWNSKLVLLDEPTAALGVAQTEQVLALVRRLGEQGLGVVLISHNLHDVFETADRIAVLRLGRNVGMFDRRTTTQQEIVAAITAGKPTKVSGIASTEAVEA
jgi:D-xylose transport system ATP-binding protein